MEVHAKGPAPWFWPLFGCVTAFDFYWPAHAKGATRRTRLGGRVENAGLGAVVGFVVLGHSRDLLSGPVKEAREGASAIKGLSRNRPVLCGASAGAVVSESLTAAVPLQLAGL